MLGVQHNSMPARGNVAGVIRAGSTSGGEDPRDWAPDAWEMT
ncbi:hypothetical protein I551_1163 [Mycobacterium ulcerans str. Harvey]|uniref:Uncharacterized protein n=1 Tax=Mycobacterium ulcerans str. Harvey TaxID=1299332 RepID=A0ABP3AN70_MYCUL|nr:hypothetical protein I551_1163 [Mycobacterium ulcerans str. Harvey]